MSDIATGNGLRLTREAVDGIPQREFSPRYEWPNQGPLLAQFWQLWKTTLFQCFGDEGIFRSQFRLKKWLQPPSVQWPWIYSHGKLYHQSGDSWRVFERTPGRTRQNRRTYSLSCEQNAIPPFPRYHAKISATHASPTTIVSSGFFGHCDTAAAIPSSLQEAFDSLSDDVAWAVQRLQLPSDQGRSVADAIASGSARLVADGSYKDGTAAWIVTTENDAMPIRVLMSRQGI